MFFSRGAASYGAQGSASHQRGRGCRPKDGTSRAVSRPPHHVLFSCSQKRAHACVLIHLRVLSLPCLVLSCLGTIPGCGSHRKGGQAHGGGQEGVQYDRRRHCQLRACAHAGNARRATEGQDQPAATRCAGIPPPPDQMIHWQQCSRQNYQLSERDMHLSACVWRGHAAGQDRAGGGARGLPGEVRRRERTLPFGEMG